MNRVDKKPPAPIKDLNKSQLVKAIGWEHPLTRVELQPNEGPQPSRGSFSGNSAEDKDDEDKEEEEEDIEDDCYEDAESFNIDMPFLAFYNQLITCASSLSIALPLVPTRTVTYRTTELLESTTKQVYRSLKIMYRNGAIALEKRLTRKHIVRLPQFL
ncbi:hypothetical protein FBU30_010894 [Linnemannia zychae]|nr:hypothetical protein FBU30_010894 [Linnemannia zychae]